MEKEFVPYELALRLKQLGFNESCFGWYADETHLSIRPQYIQPNDPNNVYNWCLAPTFSQAFRWFREKYKLYLNIESQKNESGFWVYITNNTDYLLDIETKTYEEAELECVKKLIEIAEQKEK
jgi:hypothetical protein